MLWGNRYRVEHVSRLPTHRVVYLVVQAMFVWIVRVINQSLGKGEESLPFIGVLDIFGTCKASEALYYMFLLFL